MTRYTVIIPTMWKAVDQLTWMLYKYEKHELVGEVLIINNGQGLPESIRSFKKVRILNDGKNLFVNPSWNLGVREAKFDKVIIANDDILIPEIDSLLTLIDDSLHHGDIIGADANCYEQRRVRPVDVMRICQSIGAMGYGFGVFMAVHKKDYIQVPQTLRIWFGDAIQYTALNPHVFETTIQTEMSTTTKTFEHVKRLRVTERNYYQKYIKNGK